MPYTQVTLSQFIAQISTLMDDPLARYWTVPEIQYAVWEGMRVWGAFTNCWRTRGVFNITPAQNSPYYDLSVQLPALRTRVWTLNQMVQEIQYKLLEAPSGISGAGMSGQVSVQSILNAIQSARNRFVLDTRLPLSIHSIFENPPPPTGMIEFGQSSVFVHRASWQDQDSTAWTSLWRDDAWGIDKADPLWTIEPSSPQVYSEAENSPLKIQLVPPPVASGNLEALTVDSVQIDLTNPASLIMVPDEWTHAIMYAALTYLLSSESQLKDMARAEYTDKRYQQSLEFAKDARSMIRMLVNGVPLNIDTITALDAGSPYWRNQTGAPESAGVLYDLVAVSPGIPDTSYGAAMDVVQSAPLPIQGDPTPDNFPTTYIQMGPEELDALTKYVCHSLTFKCGGSDFKSSLGEYDSFMEAVSNRKGVNRAKIKYLTPLLGQPQAEWQQRPDRMESNA